jgi:hypothetical protein
MGDQPFARSLPTRRTSQTPNKRKQTPKPREGFETSIPVFELAKVVHAFDRAATVVALTIIQNTQIYCLSKLQRILILSTSDI